MRLMHAEPVARGDGRELGRGKALRGGVRQYGARVALLDAEGKCCISFGDGQLNIFSAF